MLTPTYRPVTDQFRADSGALANAGDQELQYAPIENLAGRSQSDFPEAATFNIENGCRGFVYEEGNTVTTLAPGADFEVTWIIQAPHPGYMNLSIVKPSEDSVGKITYEIYETILSIDSFATTGGDGSTTATMPTDVSGCEAAGDCALQFYWHSDLAGQTYPTCADIIVSGSGAATTTTTTAPTTATTTAPTTATTTAPTTATTTAPTAASEEGSAETGAEATTTAPTATTAAPTATTAAPAATAATPTATTAAPEATTGAKCTRRRN
ncbi:hypothetical protein BBJ28_00020593 [Nothophytophthora sp. Chile5]|nr:hypothetical protein BBJ28_00020593 [Nothophytophthora sp. Chile5]